MGRRRMRWGFWRWWPGRTWSRPRGSDGTDGRWRIARKVAPDRVISTVDREARHTRKSKSKRRDGFRGHVAAEPETGLITDCEMTMAAGEGSTDAENGVKMACRDRFGGDSGGGDAGPGGTAETAAAGGEASPASGRDAGAQGGAGRPAPRARRRIPQISSMRRHPPGRPAPRRTRPGRARMTRRSRRARGTARRLEDLRRLGLRQRGGPRRLPRRRARHHHQAEAAAPGRGRRVHPR